MVNVYSTGTTKEVLLETESTTVVLDDCAPGDWFKLNPGFEGFYRVHYTVEDIVSFGFDP